MSDHFVTHEDFEKVDADQDENITSTSLPGESPEEDRYSGSPAQNTTEADLLSDFLSGGGPASNEATADPLISFGSSSSEPFVTESTPTQQTTENVSVVTPLCQSEGCWLKTVDPRDDIKEMEESSPSNTGETSPVVSAESSTRPKVNGGSFGIVDISANQGFESDTDSSSIISSSDNEYSSSADETDSESSNSCSESLQITNEHIRLETKGLVDNSADIEQSFESDIAIKVDGIQSLRETTAVAHYKRAEMEVNEEQSNVGQIRQDGEHSDNASKQQTGFEELEVFENDKIEPMEMSLHNLRSEVESLDVGNKHIGDALNIETDDLQPVDSLIGLSEPNMVEQIDIEKEPEAAMNNFESDDLQPVGNVVGLNEVDALEPVSIEKEPEGAALYFDHQQPVDDIVGLSETDMLDIIDILTKDDDIDTGEQFHELQSDDAFMNLIENRSARDVQLVRGEEVLSVDNISPIVSDNECNSIDLDLASSHSHSNSGSDDDISCTDSDMSGDDAGMGAWSPSPLYGESFGTFDEDEDNGDEVMDEEEQNADVLTGYEYVGTNSLNITESSETSQKENELKNLRADVKGLMEEMEAMVQETDTVRDKEQSGEFIEAMMADIDSSVNADIDSESEEAVPEVIKTNEPIASIMITGSRERSSTPESSEFLHVKFQTPTNTLFYDPECPIVEKVSMEVSDDLIDHEEQEKELGDVNLNQGNFSEEVSVEDLQAKVVKDLKDVYNKLEAKGEIEGAMELIKESGITDMDDIVLLFAKGVLDQAKSKTLHKEEKQDISEADNQCEDELQNVTEVEASNLERGKVLAGPFKTENMKENKGNSDALEITEDSVTPTCIVKEKLLVNPFTVLLESQTHDRIYSNTGIDIISENKTESQLIEKDEMICNEAENVDKEVGLKDTTEIVEGQSPPVVEEPIVVMRRKNVNTVESAKATRNEVDSMIIHDIDQAPERDIQSMIIHDNDNGNLNDFVSDLKTEQVPVGEQSEETVALEREEGIAEFDHATIGLDEVEVRHLRRLSESIEEHEHIAQLMVGESNVNPENYSDQENKYVLYDNTEIKDLALNTTLNENVTEAEPVEGMVDVIEEFQNETVEIEPSEINELQLNKNTPDVERQHTTLSDTVSDAEPLKKMVHVIKEIQNENVEIEPSDINELQVNEAATDEERKQLISHRVAEMVQMIQSEVLELIYWRDVKKTGVVFGSMMFMVLSLTFFTILSVLAYLSLAILTVTLSFRVYKNVMQAVQKTNEGHPFKNLLELDIDLKEDVVQNAADKIATNVNNCHRELRRLFLIEDYVDSLKFGLLLWLMTYVGCCFNGMTLVILAVVSIFTLPKVYETYQGPIDQNVNLVRGQLSNIMAQVSSKIPFPKKKAKTQ